MKVCSDLPTSYRGSFHNCTNIAIWAYQKGVMKVADTIVLPKVNDKGIISYLSYNGV
ncbi:hypothetical protein [Wolbachia endosymbiont of Cardiocondyla obscurior]|uniref:hypothetical protein n=1 Tax=Wolbachia endosymbiont of Cardiocondyla obscurior TaxID=2687307 RepID=UPI00157AEE70|nr:hypothetical protein [Wolbachia endosymbiont of Cardiocondyla obscurior]